MKKASEIVAALERRLQQDGHDLDGFTIAVGGTCDCGCGGRWFGIDPNPNEDDAGAIELHFQEDSLEAAIEAAARAVQRLVHGITTELAN